MANNNTTPTPSQNEVSIIASGLNITKAEITVAHDIRIDGGFDGKLVSKARVLAGETAVIKGDLTCLNFDVWGNFEGTVYVKDTICLKSGCCIKGSINAGKIVVELGAKLNGDVKMIDDAEFAKVCPDAEIFKDMKPATAPAPAHPEFRK